MCWVETFKLNSTLSSLSLSFLRCFLLISRVLPFPNPHKMGVSFKVSKTGTRFRPKCIPQLQDGASDNSKPQVRSPMRNHNSIHHSAKKSQIEFWVSRLFRNFVFFLCAWCSCSTCYVFFFFFLIWCFCSNALVN